MADIDVLLWLVLFYASLLTVAVIKFIAIPLFRTWNRKIE